jgi:hypothetical protein
VIRRRRFQFKKPLNDAQHAGRCDAVMGRPNDNPYRQGSSEHATYEESYEDALERIRNDADDTLTECRGCRADRRDHEADGTPHEAEQNPPT